MYQESEIVDLLMVLFLTPIMVATYRVIKVEGKQWFAVSYVMIAVGYVLTVAEGFIIPDALNLLEHVTHAFSGVFALVGATALFRSRRRDGAEAAR
ncbi:MAG: hypothetical protein ACYDHQ_05915 [Coriobacteriia bacterium]